MSLSRALYSVNENDDAALASALGKSSMPCNAFGRTCSPPPPKPPPPPPSPPSPPPPSPPPPSPPQEWPLQIVTTIANDGEVTEEYENLSAALPVKFITTLYKDGSSTREIVDTNISPPAQASLGTNLLASRSSFDSLFPQVACVVLVAFVALFAYRRNKASSSSATEESDENNESLLKRRMTYGAVNKA